MNVWDSENDLYYDMQHVGGHFLLQVHFVFPDNCYHMESVPFLFISCSERRKKYSNRAVRKDFSCLFHVLFMRERFGAQSLMFELEILVET